MPAPGAWKPQPPKHKLNNPLLNTDYLGCNGLLQQQNLIKVRDKIAYKKGLEVMPNAVNILVPIIGLSCLWMSSSLVMTHWVTPSLWRGAGLTSWLLWSPYCMANEPDSFVCQLCYALWIQHLYFWYYANLNEVVLLFSKYLWTPKGIMMRLGCMIMIKCGTGWLGCSTSQVWHELMRFLEV